MGTVSAVTDANFEAEVLNSDVPVLVDFWATWCAPCKAIAPAVASVADEHAGKLKVVKLDVSANMATARTYKVSSIPVLMVFKDGKPVNKQVGAQGGINAIRKLVAPVV